MPGQWQMTINGAQIVNELCDRAKCFVVAFGAAFDADTARVTTGPGVPCAIIGIDDACHTVARHNIVRGFFHAGRAQFTNYAVMGLSVGSPVVNDDRIRRAFRAAVVKIRRVELFFQNVGHVGFLFSGYSTTYDTPSRSIHPLLAIDVCVYDSMYTIPFVSMAM